MSSEPRARLLPERRLRTGRVSVALAPALLLAPLLFSAAPSRAQQAGYGQTLGTSPMEREIYDGGGGRPSGGSILDSTNPIDLMNKIRRGTAMDDATPPASAIDQALQQFEIQAAPASRPGAAPPADPRAAGAAGASAPPVATTPVWSQPQNSATPQPQPASSSQRPAL